MGPNGAYLSPRDPHRGMQPARGRDLSSRWTVPVACQLSFSMVPAPQVPRRHLGCRPQVPRRHVPGAAERHPRCRGGTPGAAAAPQVPRRHLRCRRAAPEVPVAGTRSWQPQVPRGGTRGAAPAPEVPRPAARAAPEVPRPAAGAAPEVPAAAAGAAPRVPPHHTPSPEPHTGRRFLDECVAESQSQRGVRGHWHISQPVRFSSSCRGA